MAQANQTADEAKESEKQPAKPGAARAEPARPRTVLVADTTAVDAPRVHDMPVNGAMRKFTFEPGKPVEMPQEIAAKFLRHDTFKLVNRAGEVLPYIRPPKQPEELQAGETLTLSENETVARFDELSSKALLQRCAELPGGETFAERPEREQMIAFLASEAKAKRVKPGAAKPGAPVDGDPDGFIPEAADGDEAAMFDRVRHSVHAA